MSDPLQDMVVEVREHLPAPQDRVFALLADVERTAGLGPEHRRARWTSDRRGVGATFAGWNERDGRTWEVPCRVVVHEPPTRFGWVVGDADSPTSSWTYRLTVRDDGTDVVQQFRHGPGWSYLRTACERYPDRAAGFVAGRARELETNMRAVLRAAAALLAG
ncbi:MAG: SRPBCC family protein [Actinomycetota bacterium]|nr:SRPBCC family protein [Actinomycetota bacterium]